MTSQAQKLPSLSIPIILIFSLSALLISYSAQYVWGMEACLLCKLQRIPYFIIVVFAGLAFWPSYRKFAVRVILFVLLVGLGLAGYHLLVIGGVIPDPYSVPKGIVSIEDFKRMLDAPPPCSKMTGEILGIPLAGYNVIGSFLLLLQLLRSKIPG